MEYQQARVRMRILLCPMEEKIAVKRHLVLSAAEKVTLSGIGILMSGGEEIHLHERKSVEFCRRRSHQMLRKGCNMMRIMQNRSRGSDDAACAPGCHRALRPSAPRLKYRQTE